MSLSSIGAFIRPNGLIQFLPPVNQSPAAPGPIPAADLKQLSAATGAAPSQPVQPGNAAPASFSNLLGQMVSEVNAKNAVAAEAVNGLLAGNNVSLHQAMIASEEASVSFQLMVEVRNKLLESYQELMRMQV